MLVYVQEANSGMSKTLGFAQLKRLFQLGKAARDFIEGLRATIVYFVYDRKRFDTRNP